MSWFCCATKAKPHLFLAWATAQMLLDSDIFSFRAEKSPNRHCSLFAALHPYCTATPKKIVERVSISRSQEDFVPIVPKETTPLLLLLLQVKRALRARWNVLDILTLACRHNSQTMIVGAFASRERTPENRKELSNQKAAALQIHHRFYRIRNPTYLRRAPPTGKHSLFYLHSHRSL